MLNTNAPAPHRASAQKEAVTTPARCSMSAKRPLRLGLSKSTLDKMRGAGKGPRFIKSTDRAVRYDPADLDRWIDARRSDAQH